MGGKEKPYVFSNPGAHCCLTFCTQTFKGFFLFCIAGVAYREGRVALAGWRVDPTPPDAPKACTFRPCSVSHGSVVSPGL